MADSPNGGEHGWLAEHAARYAKARPLYESYAELLEEILKAATKRLAPLAIVNSRAKSLSSFAEKILRKPAKYPDPVQDMTDLAGVRVIARLRSEVEAICGFLEERFEIDRENSIDASERLEPTEFDYRSVHYIVSPTRGVDYGVTLPDELYGAKAEVQVRTMAEHAWADFAHDLSYKGAFSPPEEWQRELAGFAAQLEAVDRGFSRLEEGLRRYATSYGKYLRPAAVREELARLEVLLPYDPESAALAARAGKLAMVLEDWPRAITLMSAHVKRDELGATDHTLLRDLGVALCKLHKAHPESEAFRVGQHYLEAAAQQTPADPDASAALGGTWRAVAKARADLGEVAAAAYAEAQERECYRRAADIDPGDPYAVGNHLECQLREDPARLTLLRPLLREAMVRCREHIAVGINLPWAWYELGRFHLLEGHPYKSLEAYAKALLTSSNGWMAETSLGSLARLSAVGGRLDGYEWARRLLLLGWAALSSSLEARAEVEELASPGCAPLTPPIVIVAGGTDARVQAQIASYAALLREVFSDFRGTIVSGGTREGVSGLVGDLGAALPDRIHTVGYLPRSVPADATVDTHRSRYHELRRTSGEGFSPLEPLQSWIDLLALKIEPADVRVLGINGGPIAAAEYRIALALGATVGVIDGSGREAERLADDPHWRASERLARLPPEARVVQEFLSPAELEPSPCPVGTGHNS
jgi:ppGpp synthetase/RelA/SpoT-type nucleotidyltranferase